MRVSAHLAKIRKGLILTGFNSYPCMRGLQRFLPCLCYFGYMRRGTRMAKGPGAGGTVKTPHVLGGLRRGHRCLSPSEGSQLYPFRLLVISAGPLPAQGEDSLTRPFDSPARFYGVFASTAPQAGTVAPWQEGQSNPSSSGTFWRCDPGPR